MIIEAIETIRDRFCDASRYHRIKFDSLDNWIIKKDPDSPEFRVDDIMNHDDALLVASVMTPERREAVITWFLDTYPSRRCDTCASTGSIIDFQFSKPCPDCNNE